MTPLIDTTYGDTRILVAAIADAETEFERQLPQSVLDESRQRFRSDTRQKEWLAARILLCHALRDPAAATALAYYPTGRPYLPGMRTGISISHSQGFVGLALSQCPRVGLDVEIRTSRAMRARQSFLSDKERQAFRTDKADIFTTLWSAKEAAYKWLDRPGTVVSQFSFHSFPLADEVQLHGFLHELPLLVHYRLYADFVVTWTDCPLPGEEVAPYR